ncbi:UDP-N-acetylglucosamine 2-epimerase (non-hydrolyzing) [Ramlibacter tataouinensis]|uniref:non-hydrolyzing UDP-N-acetylglucosamine 2-epimerase n=1 Tax=Ramlibacter tataouinensis TaxID=94132 RepID=UPI0022F3B23F|nr:UDP-N-acetylglucosamine 2-epimerase (non-hydrolyzing) [Ramlibacter tataouinensis]WBY00727.1 UDP-N-acetylglucosamine 2-epimerase (non-hydrolyzing) [Ramlibacter tataouinensis]
MKVLTVVGARPQFVKAATVSRAFRSCQPQVDEVIVHTGQHFDANMSAVFFEEMQIPQPQYQLELGGLGHGAMTGRMMESVEAILQKERPDWVLVYGDTNSTMAGALAAVKLHIPVAHVEAGLRSFNRAMPEEINRVVADHVSSLLFAPTEVAVRNLANEGIAGGKVVRSGDVMYDAALFYSQRASGTALQQIGLEPRKYFLATIHRAENVDDPARLEVIVQALARCAATLPVLLPIHPRTRKKLAETGLLKGLDTGKLRLVDPVGYLDMVQLEQHAAVVLTDSGGVQKEAYFFGVPCVTIRDETEWVELVECGANRLAPPTSVQAVVDAALAAAAQRQPAPPGLYGDGRSAQSIAHALACAA